MRSPRRVRCSSCLRNYGESPASSVREAKDHVSGNKTYVLDDDTQTPGGPDDGFVFVLSNFRS